MGVLGNRELYLKRALVERDNGKEFFRFLINNLIDLIILISILIIKGIEGKRFILNLFFFICVSKLALTELFSKFQEGVFRLLSLNSISSKKLLSVFLLVFLKL